jgi:hypothetical protein
VRRPKKVEVRKDVKTVKITYTCDECGKGELEFTGCQKSCYPSINEHVCSNPKCDYTYWMSQGQEYPRIEYVEVNVPEGKVLLPSAIAASMLTEVSKPDNWKIFEAHQSKEGDLVDFVVGHKGNDIVISIDSSAGEWVVSQADDLTCRTKSWKEVVRVVDSLLID